MFIFSDGCAGQSKQKYIFSNMIAINSNFNLTKFNWRFFLQQLMVREVELMKLLSNMFGMNYMLKCHKECLSFEKLGTKYTYFLYQKKKL